MISLYYWFYHSFILIEITFPFYNTIHPTIPIGSEAVNFFNYPYLAASIEYYQRESYLKKRKET